MKIRLPIALFAALFLHTQQGIAQVRLTNCEEYQDTAKAECLKAVNTAKARLAEFKVNFGPELKNSSCDQAEIRSILGGQPDESKLDFLQSVCMVSQNFGQLIGNTDDTSQVVPSKIDKTILQSALDRLRTGITKGLDRKENGLAQYFEFLLEGLQASKSYAAFEAADPRSNIEQRLLFCSARRNAQALYERIEWSTTVFNFATGVEKVDALNTNLPKVVASLIGIGGPLAQSKGTTCLEIAGAAETDIQAAVEKSLDASIKPYFGATSPISGMIQRRVDRLKGPAAALDSKVAQLGTQATIQQGIMSSLKGATQPAIALADAEVATYKQSFIDVMAISQWFDRFKAGLFKDPNGENTLKTLRETYDRIYDPACGTLSTTFGEINTEVKCLKNPETAIQLTASIGDLARDLDDFKRNFEAAVGSEKTYNDATKYTCAAYYCYILTNTNLRKQLMDDTTNYCKSSPTSKQQLCLNKDVSTPKAKFNLTINGQPLSLGVDDICKKAGFNENWIKNKLNQTDASQCMTAMTANTL